MPTEQHDPRNRLHCMEVQGGHGTDSQFFRRPGLDVWIWNQSRQDAKVEGGDIHYVSSCASGRITRMLMADVGGVNNHFADVACRLRDVMVRNINAIAQSSAVRQMTAQLDSTSQQGGFASVLLSTFFAPTRSWTVCNAGHPPPLLYQSVKGEWAALKPLSSELPPAADYAGNVDVSEYQNFKLRLDAGDMFFCYSNSLTECRQSNGRMMGVEGIRSLVQRLSESSNPELALNELILTIRDAHQDNLCTQDATVMLSRVTPTRVSLRDNFLAPFRFIRGANDRTSL
ncbi:PP2C family protein-serine/threonine phosphatase [Aureliella helgolandensis]|uniref:Phosphoserine phosphatase RsbU n=1 Tax=Aureliella helgolandensis TaxID=2527968 RepID=A0A518G3W3_9BACT|nr:SpoIIE family protein phosphatase [Aureliella helgolandensis]QDV23250.1 Phosphoserine phosphatase RsbU [Aureliella helgolandensis]